MEPSERRKRHQDGRSILDHMEYSVYTTASPQRNRIITAVLRSRCCMCARVARLLRLGRRVPSPHGNMYFHLYRLGRFSSSFLPTCFYGVLLCPICNFRHGISSSLVPLRQMSVLTTTTTTTWDSIGNTEYQTFIPFPSHFDHIHLPSSDSVAYSS